nr:retrovirus-related Pol polyprotein from transposon TNT 1-94 [Tanacetum cinerariifolium]
YNGRKGIGFKNPSYFEKAKDLRPTLYDENVIGLGYTSMFLTHSDEALEIKKFKRSRENKIEFAYDYENLNAIRFGNNDFAVIAGYGDVVIGSMTIKKHIDVSNDFAVIAGYGDVVIGSMMIKKFIMSKGLSKMKFEKDHFCSACKQGKIHRKYNKSKTAFALNKPLYLLHMDLYGPRRVQSINGKRYVLVVVDDYSCESSTSSPACSTDNGMEFKNKTLAKFFDEVGITQQFFAARTPQQNGVVEKRNQTLVKAARTMLTFANLPSFLWAEAIATACITQNCSIIHKRFDKTPYELIIKRKPNIKFFRVFGCICYLLYDYEDVGKLKAKGDIRVFVGYLKESAAFRIYNK